MLPVPAAVLQGWVTYGGRRVGGAGGQPGGGRRALRRGQARAGTVAVAEVPLAITN